MSLRLKLIILFLAVALIPLLLVSTLTFHNYKKSLETTCLSNLHETAAFKADKIETYFSELKNNIDVARGFYNIKQNFPVLTRLAGDPNHPEFIASQKILHAQLQHMQSVLQLTDIMLVNPQGNVVYSSNPKQYQKKFLNPLADPEQKAFEEGKETIYLSDIFPSKEADNRPTLLISAPAVDFDGVFIGVIVFEVDTTSVYKVILDVTGLGKTGEVLVGRKSGNQVVFLSPLKFDPQAVLTRKLDIGQTIGNPIQQAVQGKTGAGISIDYRGKEVIAAWRYISYLNWGMVAKIDTEEAFAQVTQLRNLAFIIMGIVIVLSSITAFSMARSIAEPIKKLSEGAAIVGSGNLDYKIEIPLKDEVGQLSRAFDKMTHDLKQTTASRDELNREIAERKKTEAALITAHQRLVLAQQSAGAGIWDWDIHTGKLEWSPELFRLFGLDPKEQPSFDLWRSIIHPQDYEQAQKRIEQAIQSRLSLDSEYRIFLPTGQVRWINALGSAVYDENGKPQTMSGICIDITERKEIERALWDSQKRFSNVFHTSPAGIFVTRMADGRFLEVNEAYMQITGYSAEEICGCTSLDLNLWVNPQDRKTIIDLLGQQGRIDNSEVKLRRKNGQIVDLLYSAVIYEQAGEPCILVAMMNVSEHKKAEEALRNSEDRYRSLVELSPDALFVNRNDKIEFLNPAALQLFGATRADEVLGKSPLDIFHPDYHDRIRERIRELLDGRPVPLIEEKIVQMDGTVRDVEVTAAPFDDKQGRAIQVILRDITERIQTEEALRVSRENLNRAQAVGNIGSWSLNIQHNELAWSDENHRIFGIPKGTPLTYETFLSTIHPDDRDFVDTKWKAALLGEEYDIEHRLIVDGKTKWVREKAYLELDKHGAVLGGFGITQDITKRKQAEEAVRKSRDELEMRVKERTKELDKIVNILENEVRERIAAEKTVRQGEERYRSLTVATTQLVWTTDAQGQVVTDMPSWRTFSGQSMEELQGWGWINALHPEDRDHTAKVWTQSVQEKNLYQTEYRIRRHDGVYRYMSVRGVPVIESDGSIREWVGTCTDITERKLAEEKQSVTKSLLELFVKTSTRKEYFDAVVEKIRNWSGCEFAGIRIRDNERNIPYESCIGFNEDFLATENAMHLDRDNCVCMRTILENPQASEMNLTTDGGSFHCNDSLLFLNGLPEEDKKEYRGTCMKHGLQSIAVIPIRYREEVMGAIHIADLKKDMVSLSKIQFIETTIAPLVGEAAQRFNAELELEKYRQNLEELVRQRTLELEKANRHLHSEAIHRQQIAENLARSNKDLEQFAYVASHDLQEPLRAVSGFVELLKRNLQNSLDDKTAEYMNFTIDGARRMQSLVNGLLEYSRVSAKGQNPEQIDSKAALDLAIAHLLTSIKESEAAITADDLPRVHFDTVQLTQLFQNLIGNAIKFHGQQPPQVHISAARRGDAWQFAVADNGIGIEPQYAERIFLIFQRLHTRKQYPGTGIGLAICKKIIERHGGKIWVESKPGVGSTFYFTIPDTGDTK